jgi:hypothetical protein
MPLQARQVSVGNLTPVELVPEEGDGSTATIKNKGSVSIFLGPTGVTSGNGYEVAASEVVIVTMGAGDGPLLAIAASGTQTVHVLAVRAGVS